jgi:hypothetical protein
MKSKEIHTLILIGIFSTVLSIVLSSIFISNDENRSEKVEVIPVISSELKRPSSQYFNADSVNPTQLIRIGGEVSPSPFGSQ